MTFNVIFILIMIISLLIDRRSDRTKNNIRVPLTEEIMVFYSATILYDLFDSGTILFTGITSPVGKIMIQITVFDLLCCRRIPDHIFSSGNPETYCREKRAETAEKNYLCISAFSDTVHCTSCRNAFYRCPVLF